MNNMSPNPKSNVSKSCIGENSGVNTSTEASGSKPRSNTKKNRILPAKSENKKKVEDHPRTNKSVWTKVNRVDSSISSKRVVINSNSESMCKTCLEAMGKLFANVGYQWRSTGKKVAFGKLNCGYQWRPTGKKFALGKLCPLTKLSVQCCSKLDLEEEMAPVRISSGLEPIMTFVQISSNLASQMSQRRLLASLQAPFLKEKKGVRFSALYL
ncbi:hypothetical protein Tco_0569890 [Tanacetum coccineum]